MGLLEGNLPLVPHAAVANKKVFYLEISLFPSRLERGAALLGKVARRIPQEERL